MNYAYIENGQVIEWPKTLPKAWKNISWLDLMSDEELKKVGWFPVVEDNKQYDSKTHTQEWPFYTNRKDDILAEYRNTEKPIEAIKKHQINIFRSMASNDIETRQPAYRQRNASLWIYDQEEIDQIKTDIETIRTKFHDKEALVNECTTIQEIKTIEW